jgi:hypothetical protein
MLELNSLDLDEIGNALADQTDYEHRWPVNPETGEIRARSLPPVQGRTA